MHQSAHYQASKCEDRQDEDKNTRSSSWEVQEATEEEQKMLEKKYNQIVNSVQQQTFVSKSENSSRQQHKVSQKDFTLIKVLGTGTYGKVLLVRHKTTDQLYAMKILKKQKILKSKQVAHTLTERRILENIDHPFIVKMRYAFTDEHKLYFVLDYCHGGELFFYLSHLRRFKEHSVKFYMSNVLLAIKKLHESNIIYRDLKPENILIDKDGYALLTDFGLSKDQMGDGQRTHSLCGTAEYLAPEVLQEKRAYGKPCDWWSFGCVLYEMLSGQPPFYNSNRNKMFNNIKHAQVRFFQFHSDEARDLISKLLVKNPDQRLGSAEGGIQEIMDHPFFNEIDWDRMLARQIDSPYKPVLSNPTDTSHFDQDQTKMPIYSPPGSNLSIFEQESQFEDYYDDTFANFSFEANEENVNIDDNQAAEPSDQQDLF